MKDLLLIRPDGSMRPVTNDYEHLREAVGGSFDYTRLGNTELGAFVPDEGLYTDPVNVPVSMFHFGPLCGNAVICRYEPDDEGETVPPPEGDPLRAVRALAMSWHSVVSQGPVIVMPSVDMNATAPGFITQVWVVEEDGKMVRVDEFEGGER